jgi:ribonuclease HII
LLAEQYSSSIRSRESTRSAKLSVGSIADETATDMWHFERPYHKSGLIFVVGIDEAGRGPIAGPVVAACAVLPQAFKHSGIIDSKRLSAKQRDEAFVRITSEATFYAIGIVDPFEIDRINILRATHAAMKTAVEALPCSPEVILVDGLAVPAMAECEQVSIVGGDGLSVSIAAASIIAKVTRDRIMIELSAEYPQYGFERHKGYGSQEHRRALEAHGPCPIHRQSFSPVSAFNKSLVV